MQLDYIINLKNFQIFDFEMYRLPLIWASNLISIFSVAVNVFMFVFGTSLTHWWASLQQQTKSGRNISIFIFVENHYLKQKLHTLLLDRDKSSWNYGGKFLSDGCYGGLEDVMLITWGKGPDCWPSSKLQKLYFRLICKNGQVLQ